jgi:hypothetical protein
MQHTWEIRNAYKILVRIPERKRPLRRPRDKWEDIRMNIRETGWEGLDSSGSVQGSVVGSCE